MSHTAIPYENLRQLNKPFEEQFALATYNIDPAKITEAITAKTTAITVVHLYGRCCEMGPILNIANQYRLRVIEDCAQAHGATYQGKQAGTFGDFGAFSFYPTKNLGALGDAGAVICKSEAHYLQLRQLRNYGSEKKYHNGIIGYNSRLDEIQASFLRVKLPHLDEINAHKKKLAALYLKQLNNNFTKPVVSADYEHVFHIFNIRHPERDRLKQYLADQGIMTEIHYPILPHQQAALKDFNHLSYPIASEIHATTLSLPCSFVHQTEQIEHIIHVLNKFS